MAAAALAMLGIGALKGLWGYKEQKEQYKIQKEIAAYRNKLNEEEYVLNSNIISYNESLANEDYLIQLLANDKQEMVAQGSLSTAQNFAERGGNSARLVEDSVTASFESQAEGIERAYEQKMQDIIFDRAKAYLNFRGGKTWMPTKPSMFNSIIGGILGMSSAAVDEYYKDIPGESSGDGSKSNDRDGNNTGKNTTKGK